MPQIHKKLKVLLLSDYAYVFGFGMFTPLYALYAIHVGASKEQAAFIWSMYTLIAGSTAILAGRAENLRQNKETIVIAGAFIELAATFLLMLFNNLPWLILSLIIYAIGLGVCLPAWKMLYATYEDKGKETEEWGILDGGNYFVAALAAAVLGVLINVFSFRGVLVFMFVAHLVGFIIVSRLVSAKNT